MNFFEAYNTYRKDTESHQNFHLWSAVYAISCLLGRKCFLPQGVYTIYPQLYVIIVGEAATRKSTAANIAKRIIRDVGTVPMAPTSTSREALVDFMAKKGQIKYSIAGKDYAYHQVAAFANEFDTFVGGQHVNKSIITFMTDIWDENPYVDLTRKSGSVEVPEPYFSLLGCCVPAWFESSVKGDLITGGFTRRTVFVYEEELDHLEAWPQGNSVSQNEVWPMLIEEAKRINKMTGEFTYTPAAIDLQSKMYEEQMSKRRNVDEKVKSYYSSRHDLLKKLCICLSAGFGDSMVVDASIVQLADELLARTENRLEKLFRGVGRNELKGHSERIVEAVRKKGPTGVTNRDLIRTFYSDLSLQELEEVLMVLVRTGQLRMRPGADPTIIEYTTPEAALPQLESCSLFERVCQRRPSDSLSPSQQAPAISAPPGVRSIPRPSESASPTGQTSADKPRLSALIRRSVTSG